MTKLAVIKIPMYDEMDCIISVHESVAAAANKFEEIFAPYFDMEFIHTKRDGSKQVDKGIVKKVDDDGKIQYEIEFYLGQYASRNPYEKERDEFREVVEKLFGAYDWEGELIDFVIEEIEIGVPINGYYRRS